MKILVADDYSTMRRIIRNLLSQLGYTDVEESPDGSDALQKLRGASYGLVICDQQMEPMDGLTCLKEVRADAKLRAIPFILVTSGGHTEDQALAKAAGVNAFLQKPFNAAALKQQIDIALKS